MNKRNFNKWIAFAFPYIAQLIHRIVSNVIIYITGFELNDVDSQTLFILLNSFAILLGINVIKNYTHNEDCKNYSPIKQKGK